MRVSLSIQFILAIIVPFSLTIVGLIIYESVFIQVILNRWQERSNTHPLTVNLKSAIRKILSTVFIEDAQNQYIHNYIVANKLILENQLKEISIAFHTMTSFLQQFQSLSVLRNSAAQQTVCSMRQYDQNKCESWQYQEQVKNPLYLNQWFHVNISTIAELSVEQELILYQVIKSQRKIQIPKDLFQTQNFDAMTFFKVLYNTRKNALVGNSFLSNTLMDSMIVVAPSRTSNYANSQNETCNKYPKIEKYDARCRPWYQTTISEKTKMSVSAPILTQSTFTVLVLCSKLVTNVLTGFPYSVISTNTEFNNIKQKIFAKQDIVDESSPLEAYTILIHRSNQTVIHHRYWKPEDKVFKQWSQIEYNNTLPYDEKDKANFNSELSRISKAAQLASPDFFMNRSQTNNFYFKFRKNNLTYLSALYPVVVLNVEDKATRSINYQYPMYIGRVQKDRSAIFEEILLQFIPLLSVIAKIEVVISILWLLVNVLHYAAVLYYSQDQAFDKLIAMIISNCSKHYLEKKHVNKKINYRFDSRNKLSKNSTKDFIYSPPLNQKEISPLLFGKNMYKMQTMKVDFERNLLVDEGTLNKSMPEVPDPIQNRVGSLLLSRQKTVNSTKRGSGTNSIDSHDHFMISRIAQRRSFLQIPSPQQTQRNLISNFNEIVPVNSDKPTPIISNNELFRKQRLSSIQSDTNYIPKNKESMYLHKLENIDFSFYEMHVIIESLKGIFHLLKLAEHNSELGNYETSLLQYSSSLSIFRQVRNRSQQILCLFEIGKLHSISNRLIEAIGVFEAALILLFEEEKEICQESLKKENSELIAKCYRYLAANHYQIFIECEFTTPSIANFHLLTGKIYIQQSIRIFHSISKNQRFDEYVSISLLAEILLRIGNVQEAQYFISKSISELLMDNSNISEILKQQFTLLQSKIYLKYGKRFLACFQLIQLFEESPKLYPYIYRQSVFTLYQELGNAPELFCEIRKFQTQPLHFSIVIELNYQFSLQSLLTPVKQVLQSNIKSGDTIQFNVYINNQYLTISKSYKFETCQTFTSSCLEEIKRVYDKCEGNQLFDYQKINDGIYPNWVFAAEETIGEWIKGNPVFQRVLFIVASTQAEIGKHIFHRICKIWVPLLKQLSQRDINPCKILHFSKINPKQTRLKIPTINFLQIDQIQEQTHQYNYNQLLSNQSLNPLFEDKTIDEVSLLEMNEIMKYYMRENSIESVINTINSLRHDKFIQNLLYLQDY